VNKLCNVAIFGLLAVVARQAAAYDPMDIPAGYTNRVQDLTVRDAKRDRDIPVRVYLPSGGKLAPVVIFSHGLGGSREGSPYLGRHWSARGYAAVFIQHPGSDESVWKNVSASGRMTALKKEASSENFLLRVKDVSAVLDQLERWNIATNHIFAGRMDLRRVGMSGHSFGAVTTQAVSGQRAAGGRFALQDQRIRAALAMSPSVPRGGGDPEKAFGDVAIPWMLMTGTKDDSVIVNTDASSRLDVYPALPPGGKYELVLHDAEHSAFTDRALPGDREPRNPNHHQAILALSTAFWDAWLREDPAARAWLDGEGPASVLDPKDRWKRK
jgi:predicted dienelactone hydrolase